MMTMADRHRSTVLLLGAVRVFTVDQKVKIAASPKIPKAADASKHKPGGGNVQICQCHSTSQPHERALPLL